LLLFEVLCHPARCFNVIFFINSEIVETELKYGKDLRIIVDEFYHPMLGTEPRTKSSMRNDSFIIVAPPAGGP